MFFELLDPELLAEYRKIAKEVSGLGRIHYETHREDETSVLRALLVKLMTNEHKDLSDWKRGFAGLIPMGEFERGDMLF